jgi:hypothetical protein
MYCDSTGEILDLAGENNIIFYRDERTGKWTYRLLDVLYHNGAPLIREIRKFIHRITPESRLSPQSWYYVFNAINCVRTINGLAAALGMKEKIILPDADYGEIYERLKILFEEFNRRNAAQASDLPQTREALLTDEEFESAILLRVNKPLPLVEAEDDAEIFARRTRGECEQLLAA